MKRIFFVVCLLIAVSELHAQRVRVRMNLPVGARVGAPGAAPFRGAVWIGPEWRWQRGQYVSVPGYWARPARFNAVWVPGHWKYTRRGYKWVPGRWR
ncbi:MAG: hypothetical protein NTW29_17560 [Bacteroidetes bacterium]|nr:hypothetical protein [Bacteroidota bacterium]